MSRHLADTEHGLFHFLCFVFCGGCHRDNQRSSGGEPRLHHRASGVGHRDGLFCFFEIRTEIDRFGLVWFGSVRFGSVRFEGLKGTMLDAVVKESLEESRRGLTQ